MNGEGLIHDWNVAEFETLAWGRHVELNDETLRDGLQSPSVTDPPVAAKIRLLRIMDRLGIHAADIGLPGAGARAVADVTRLCEEIRDSGLAIDPNCAARTMLADVEPVVRIAQRTGVAIEVSAFIGSSPIRRFAEGWTLDRMLRTAEESISFCVNEGMRVMFVTEDTTRADASTLRALYGNAIGWGARRVCLSDTVGHATPSGVRTLVRFVKRVGNVETDLLLVNLALAGVHQADLSLLSEYCELVARECDVPLPPNYPVIGADAFRTATGVHAAAIIKAQAKGADWLADRVYSGVPASLVGRHQVIDVGPMSGISNVRYWLAKRGYDADDAELCERVFSRVKEVDHTLSEEELGRIVEGVRAETSR